MILRRFILFFFILAFGIKASSQRASTAFAFQRLSSSARVTALGQQSVALYDQDAAMAFDNPALLHDSVQRQISFQHAFLPASINFGSAYFASYAQRWDVSYMVHFGYLGHGDIVRADALGNRLGNFKARAYRAGVSFSKRLYERVKVGMGINYLQESIDNFSANGISFDLGVLYHLEDKKLNVGLSWQDIGWQLTAFDDTKSTIRSNLQLGFSKELAHLPFRFSINYKYLNHWNLRYESDADDESIISLDGSREETDFSIWMDNFGRHFVVNGEFFIGKKRNLRLRLGYDHQRRREMTISNWNSMAGFSFGGGLNLKGVIIDYGWASYHLAGGIHHLGLQLDWARLFGSPSTSIL